MLFSPNNCKNSEFNTIIKDKITINNNKTNLNLINKSNLNLINQNANNNFSHLYKSKDNLQQQGSLLHSLSEEFSSTNATQVNSINSSLEIDFNKNEKLNPLYNNIYDSTNNNELNQFSNVFELANSQSNLNNLIQQNLLQNICQYDNNYMNINQLESLKQIEQENNNLQKQINKTSNHLLEQIKNEYQINQLVEQINNEAYINNILMTPNTPEINGSTVSSPEQFLYENVMNNEKLYLNSPESCSSLISGNGDINNFLLTPKDILINDFSEIPIMINSPEINENNLEINNLKSILDKDNNNQENNGILCSNDNNNYITGFENNLSTEFNNLFFDNLENKQEMIESINKEDINNSIKFLNENMLDETSTSSLFNIMNTESNLSSGYTSPLLKEQITQASLLNNNYNLLFSNIINGDNIISNTMKVENINTPLLSNEFTNENLIINENEQEKEEINNKENKLNECMKGKPFIYVETCEEEDNDNKECDLNKGKKKYKKKYYVCSICQHKSKRHYNVEVHMKTHEKNRPRPFKCEKCNKYFCRQHDLKRHEIVHNDKMLHCPMCDKRFGRMDSMKRHIGCKSCKKRQVENKKN